MIYMRGNPHDFDEWALQGNKGWSFKDCLPYFNKADTMMAGEEARHETILKKAFLKAGYLMGYPVLTHQNSGQVGNAKYTFLNKC